MNRLVMLLLVSLFALPAPAAPIALHPGMGGVPNLGAIRCAMYNEIYPNGPTGLRQATLYWTDGYVYARTGKTLDDFLAGRPGANRWTFDTLTGHVVEFCRAHPDMQVSAAVDDLWTKLGS